MPSEFSSDSNSSSSTEAEEIALQLHRLQFAEIARTLKAADTLPRLGNLIQSLELCNKADARVADLLVDLKGQVMEALTNPEHLKRWGLHYIPSLAQAHLLEMCNNFKDPGVQHYGGALFSELRDQADDYFISLPPPQPNPARVAQAQAQAKAQAPPAQRQGGRPAQVLLPLINSFLRQPSMPRSVA